MRNDEFEYTARYDTWKHYSTGNDKRFFDIHFAPFQKDPFPILAELYQFLGEEFTAEAKQRMCDWRNNTPRDKHGRHQYDAAEFGIELEVLAGRFRFYSERYLNTGEAAELL